MNAIPEQKGSRILAHRSTTGKREIIPSVATSRNIRETKHLRIGRQAVKESKRVHADQVRAGVSIEHGIKGFVKGLRDGSRQRSYIWAWLVKPWREAEIWGIRHDNGTGTDGGELIEHCGQIAHCLLDSRMYQRRCIRGICSGSRDDVLQVIRTPKENEESLWIGCGGMIDIRLDLIENAKGGAERLSIGSRAAEGSIGSAR